MMKPQFRVNGTFVSPMLFLITLERFSLLFLEVVSCVGSVILMIEIRSIGHLRIMSLVV
jgi:hypothetical protein